MHKIQALISHYTHSELQHEKKPVYNSQTLVSARIAVKYSIQDLDTKHLCMAMIMKSTRAEQY